jgi:hypothetical protein
MSLICGPSLTPASSIGLIGRNTTLQPEQNPNAEMPRLGLGSLRARPLPFTADAQKIALPMTPSLPSVEITGAVYARRTVLDRPARAPGGIGRTGVKDRPRSRQALRYAFREIGGGSFCEVTPASIAHAFERKLVRKDVVTELVRLFEEQRGETF